MLKEKGKTSTILKLTSELKPWPNSWQMQPMCTHPAHNRKASTEKHNPEALVTSHRNILILERYSS